MIVQVLVDEENLRVDKFLANKLEEYSRENIKQWINAGKVTINGNAVKASEKTVLGTCIHVEIQEKPALEAKPEKINLNIVFEDEDIIVVNKPQGMVVHPGAGNHEGTLVNALLYYTNGKLSEVDQSGVRPGIVHRLDKDTSGLMLVAKNDKTHKALAASLKDREVTRIYETIVHGFFTEREGIIDAPIARDSNNRIKMAVSRDGKKAKTYFRVLQALKHGTYVRVKLDSGRTHQIRVHMKYISHPILGDKVYGYKSDDFGLRGQCLHARELGFYHPVTAEYMHFTSKLPDWFSKTLDSLGYQDNQNIEWEEDWPKV